MMPPELDIRPEEVWAASRTLAMHQRGGRCAQCREDGCRLMVWAESVRRMWARQGGDLPTIGSMWSPTEGRLTHERGGGE